MWRLCLSLLCVLLVVAPHESDAASAADAAPASAGQPAAAAEGAAAQDASPGGAPADATDGDEASESAEDASEAEEEELAPEAELMTYWRNLTTRRKAERHVLDDSPATRADAAARELAASAPVPAALEYLDAGGERLAVQFLAAVPLAGGKRGTVIVIDESGRVPAETALVVALRDELSVAGMDVLALAIDAWAPPPLPARVRPPRPFPNPDADSAETDGEAESADAAASTEAAAADDTVEGAGDAESDAVDETSTADPEEEAAEAWPPPTVPVRRSTRRLLAAPAAKLDATEHWQTVRKRTAAIVDAALARARKEAGDGAVSIVAIGIAADLLTDHPAAREGTTAIVFVDVGALPVRDLVDTPAALQKLAVPALALAWRHDDRLAAIWPHVQGEQRVDLEGAPPSRVARRVRGWLSRNGAGGG